MFWNGLIFVVLILKICAIIAIAVVRLVVRQ